MKMSDPKPMYQILPVGEYTVFTGYGDAEKEKPVTEKDEMTDERELFLNQLDGWIRDLNLAANVIKPFIRQKRITILGKNGKEKVVVPCMKDLYLVLVQMQNALYNLRKDGNR